MRIGASLLFVLLCASSSAAQVRLIPASFNPEFVSVRSERCLSEIPFSWRAENVLGTLKLYGPLLPFEFQCVSQTYVSLSHACIAGGNCLAAVRRIEVSAVPRDCLLAQGIPECARQISPEITTVIPFTNFRMPERFSLWEAPFTDPPGGSDTLLFERQGNRTGVTRTDTSDATVKIARAQGTVGPVVSFMQAQTLHSAFRDPAFGLVVSNGSSNRFYNQYTPGRSPIFPGGVSDPVRLLGRLRIVDPDYPGETLTIVSCTDRFQPLQCELLLDDRYRGQIECDERISGSCDLRFGDGQRFVDFKIPLAHLAYDAWFGPATLDAAQPCCIYFADAFAVRLN